MADNGLRHWLQQQNLAELSRQPLSGGCCASVYRLQLSDGRNCLLKLQAGAEAGQFAGEAAGLVALKHTATLRVPAVLWQDADCLLLEYIETAPPGDGFDRKLGRKLAELHAHSASVDGFGFMLDTFCGATRQPNTWQQDGWQFFTEQRLLYLGRLCVDAGRLAMVDMRSLESLCQKLPALIPEQLPALLHGDLWRGNVISDRTGEPVLIDPAVYYGWPEADLAMTRLFGGFCPALYEGYQELKPLQPGWEDRIDLYNLWHLLNHLWLFGGNYLTDVRRVLQSYV